jgi:hypothetical protein
LTRGRQDFFFGFLHFGFRLRLQPQASVVILPWSRFEQRPWHERDRDLSAAAEGPPTERRPRVSSEELPMMMVMM